jgi:hypothetical protein
VLRGTRRAPSSARRGAGPALCARLGRVHPGPLDGLNLVVEVGIGERGGNRGNRRGGASAWTGAIAAKPAALLLAATLQARPDALLGGVALGVFLAAEPQFLGAGPLAVLGLGVGLRAMLGGLDAVRGALRALLQRHR